MNAEVKASNGVDFCRVCELEPMDMFLYQGVWFRVTVKNKKIIGYVHGCNPEPLKKTSRYYQQTFGVKNQQFVQVVKKTKAE